MQEICILMPLKIKTLPYREFLVYFSESTQPVAEKHGQFPKTQKLLTKGCCYSYTYLEGEKGENNKGGK